MLFDPIDLVGAFDAAEFEPFFQPLVELRTGQLAGFEVLARWNHPRLGLILPDQFIPTVERIGLIDKLTQAILTKAFATSYLVDSALTLSFNISPPQLLDFNLPDNIAGAAQRGGFALDRVTIEITESALVDDLARAKAVAQELKALHCRLALDDFGTGYSSLKHLHALPFDELKVDRGFVNSMTQNRDSRKIVASVVGLGQSLGLITAAEGVETQEEADMLFWMGCDIGQGWLYGKPVPADQVARVISDAFRQVHLRRPAPVSEGSMSLGALPGQRLAQLQAIYDGAPVGLCLLDRDLRYVSLNRRLAEMNGVAAEAHLGRTPAEVVPKVFLIVEPHMRRALAGEPVIGVEVPKPPAVTGQKGQTLMISYQPVRDEAGEVMGISVAIMDITERKQAEEALQKSEEHYRHMVTLSPHVPWVLNTEGEVMEAGPRWESITGQPMEQALGNGWLRVLHPNDVAPTLEAIHLSLHTGHGIDVKYRVRKPGEDWKWMRSRGSPRFGPTGKIVCIYGVVEEFNEVESSKIV
jgi:PAS domain S-box-containing protein